MTPYGGLGSRSDSLRLAAVVCATVTVAADSVSCARKNGGNVLRKDGNDGGKGGQRNGVGCLDVPVTDGSNDLAWSTTDDGRDDGALGTYNLDIQVVMGGILVGGGVDFSAGGLGAGGRGRLSIDGLITKQRSVLHSSPPLARRPRQLRARPFSAGLAHRLHHGGQVLPRWWTLGGH
jgi:hypothetical protein